MASGLASVVSTLLVTLRTNVKYDLKAEMFRNAAGQYRILATKLEERVSMHRHLLNEVDTGLGDPKQRHEAHLKEKEDMVNFFNTT